MRGGGDGTGPTELPVLDVGIKYRLEEAEAAGEEVHQGRQAVQAHAGKDAPPRFPVRVFRAFGSDLDPHALELAKANAARAGVAHLITFEQRDLKDFAPQSEKGTLITNPPYGERLLDVKAAEEIYRLMGQKFERRHGWSYTVISPSDDFEYFFGRKADKRRKLYNGMIKCQAYMYFK